MATGPRATPAAQVAELAQRVDAHLALIELGSAEAAARQMLALAARSRSGSHRAQALCALAHVQTRQEALADAVQTATAALQAARAVRGARRRGLVALALLRQALANLSPNPVAAAAQAQEAAQLFQALGDAALEGQALRVLGGLRMQREDTPEHRAIVERAIALARQAGDRTGEGRAIGTLTQGDMDLAMRLRGQQQGLQLYIAVGDRHFEATALHNLSLNYGRLGLFRRAARCIRQTIAMREAMARPAALVLPWITTSYLEAMAGHGSAGLAAWQQVHAAHAADPQPFNAELMAWYEGILPVLVASPSKRTVAALRRVARETEFDWARSDMLAHLAGAQFDLGQHAAAWRSARQAVRALQQFKGRSGGGLMSDAVVWWQLHRAALAMGQQAEATEVLDAAYAELLKSVSHLSDEGLRRSFLHAPQHHAAIVRAWAQQQGAALYSNVPDHLAGNHDLRQPLQRLVDTGLRLNAIDSEAALHEFLIEELAELLGTQRVLLLLEPRQPGDELQRAGAQLPRDEDADALQAAITPWLIEARSTRDTRLRHGPDGVHELDQRSCLVAPLVAQVLGQQTVLGYLYTDLEGLFGRLREADRNLLATLAAQAAVALANLRTTEGLERQVAERTAALAIVNSVQAALASKLDVQAIHKLVGDKVRDLFDAQSVLISLFDHAKQLEVFTYIWEKGEYALVAPRPISKLRRHLIDTRRTHVDARITPEVIAHWQGTPIGDTPPAKSAIFVPMIVGDGVKGYVSIQNLDRYEAFTDADMRLLETLTGSLAVAIENVRLFNETKEALERQTATAEVLQVISASPGDTQPVFETIVHSCQRLFGGRAVAITVPRGTMIETVAFATDGTPGPGKGGFLSPWPLDTHSAAGASLLGARMVHVPDTEVGVLEFPRMRNLAIALGYRSGLFVPLMHEGVAQAVIAILRGTVGAFTEREIALAKTFADQAVIAIQNARLFKELELRNREVSDTLQQQTATSEVLQVVAQSMADAQPVFDKILESCGRLFRSNGQVLNLLDDNNTLHLVAQRETTETWNGLGSETQLAAIRDLGTTAYPLQLSAKEAAWMRRAKGVYHFSDVLSDPKAGPSVRAVALTLGFSFAQMGATMFAGDRCIGSIVVNRNAGDGFSAKEQALLATFADQAVIAIQNARLFRETHAALERQTATSAILKVISESPTDVQPVFDAIVGTAIRLLSCDMAFVQRRNDAHTFLVAAGATPSGLMTGSDIIGASFPIDAKLNFPSRVMLDRATLHLPDWSTVELPAHEAHVRATFGINASLFVPILVGDECLGTLTGDEGRVSWITQWVRVPSGVIG